VWRSKFGVIVSAFVIAVLLLSLFAWVTGDEAYGGEAGHAGDVSGAHVRLRLVTDAAGANCIRGQGSTQVRLLAGPVAS
jgi:hypothetical protein